jgi:RHS repeat-associated protein
MACYNNECCAYDSLGNPYMYRCHDLEWAKVRKLARFDANTFEYNASGIRFKKNNTVYTLVGDRILKETDGTKTLTYYYANGNAPIGFNYNGTDYYFRKNIQGDVVGIYNASGYIVARYVYDAWGNHKIYDANNNEVTSANHIGYINPIRYRGYYFDVETNLYYLQTRYYDPETGRFLNSDAIEYLAPEQLGGLNLYAYCGNNPVMLYDPMGHAWETVFDIISLFTSAVEVCVNPADPMAWVGLAGDVVDVALPFIAGVGETVRIANAVRKSADVLDDVDDVYDTCKAVDKVTELRNFTRINGVTKVKTIGDIGTLSGNSLKVNRINYGYQLIDSNANVVKYGETLHPTRRYSQAWLKKRGYKMELKVSGTKRAVHEWQHDMIEGYIAVAGHRPKMNFSLW